MEVSDSVKTVYKATAALLLISLSSYAICQAGKQKESVFNLVSSYNVVLECQESNDETRYRVLETRVQLVVDLMIFIASFRGLSNLLTMQKDALKRVMCG